MDRSIDWKSPKTYIIGTGALLLLLAIALVMFLNHKPKTWVRADYPSVQDAVLRGENLSDFSSRHGQLPPVILAMFNREPLNTEYPTTCYGRYGKWPKPSHDFCNDRLNLREANTLTPHQSLRILVTNSPPSGIEQVAQAAGQSRQVAVLVDGTSQKNLDYAAGIALQLQQRGQLASVWVYMPTKVFEYIDQGRVIGLDRSHAGAEGALDVLSVQPIDKIVLVTGADLKGRLDVTAPQRSKPIIGFCTASACESQMRGITHLSQGSYIPYGG